MKKHAPILPLLCVFFLSFLSTGCGLATINKAIKNKNYDDIKFIASKLDKDDPGVAKYFFIGLIHRCQDNKAVEAFLDGGYPLDLTDLNKNTHLMLASNSGCYGSAKLFVEKGADVDARQIDGWTPLLLATKSMPTPLRYEWYYSMGINPKGVWQLPKDFDTSQKPEIAKLLIERTRNIDQRGQKGETPLMLACESGYPEVATLLLEKGANIEASDYRLGWTPLMWACFKDHSEIVQLLIEKGADVNAVGLKNGYTSLMVASLKGSTRIFELLLSSGANINIKSKKGVTALALAANTDNSHLFELLVANDAEITRINDDPYINAKLFFHAAQSTNEHFQESSKEYYQIAADSFLKAHDEIKSVYNALQEARIKRKKEEFWYGFAHLLGNLVANVTVMNVFDTNTFCVSSPAKMDLSSIDNALEKCREKMDECEKYRQQCLKLLD